MDLYLCVIEPVYSQGVGDYKMLTRNMDYANKLFDEQRKFMEYIIKDEGNANDWEFYERLYKITDTKVSKKEDTDEETDEEIDEESEITEYYGYLIFNRYYNDIINEPVSLGDTLIRLIETDRMIEDYVYSSFDPEEKERHISVFSVI